MMNERRREQRLIVTFASGLALCLAGSALTAETPKATAHTNPELGPADHMSLETASARYSRLYSDGIFLEASDAAKLMIQQMLGDGDPNHFELARALEQLARAQYQAGENDSAIENYRESIEHIEAASDWLNENLFSPLHGLAQSLVRAERYADAAQVFEQAAHITRVNEGPHNIRQAEILGEMSDLHQLMGNYKYARNVQEHLLELYRREYPDTDPRVISTWERCGEILTLAGDHLNAQEAYVSAIDMIREADRPNSLLQIPMQRKLAESYLHHAAADLFTRIEMARVAYERIVNIVERNDQATNLDKAEAHLEMGDFMQRYGDWWSALRSYRRAWDSLSADENSIQRRGEVFGQPAALNSSSPSSPETYDESQSGDDGIVMINFDVNARGRVENARVSQSSAGKAAQRKVLQRARKLVFRPRFEDRDPVETLDMHRDFLTGD